MFTFKGEQKSELPDLPPIEETGGTGDGGSAEAAE